MSFGRKFSIFVSFRRSIDLKIMQSKTLLYSLVDVVVQSIGSEKVESKVGGVTSHKYKPDFLKMLHHPLILTNFFCRL